jgi:hypothetical protein
MALAMARLPIALQLPRSVATVAAVLLAICAVPLRSDFNDFPDRAWQRFIRTVAVDIQQIMPPESRLLIVPTWTDAFAVGMRYDLWRFDMAGQKIDAIVPWHLENYGELLRSEAHRDRTYLLIQNVAQGAQEEAVAVLRLPTINYDIVLFAWRDGGWTKVKSWPVPDSLFHGH